MRVATRRTTGARTGPGTGSRKSPSDGREARRAPRKPSNGGRATKVRLSCSPAPREASLQPSSPEIPNAPPEQAQLPPWTRGDLVTYFDKRTGVSEIACIVGVHTDDAPNMYYTIRLTKSGTERQTSADRILNRIHEQTAAPALMPSAVPPKAGHLRAPRVSRSLGLIALSAFLLAFAVFWYEPWGLVTRVSDHGEVKAPTQAEVGR